MTDYKALYEQANEMDKDELVSSIVSMEVNIMKLKEKNEELKVHFNLVIQLIKGCKTKEQLQKLKELGMLKE
jgi:16S rRNA U1498 N3-methylase RsmE